VTKRSAARGLRSRIVLRPRVARRTASGEGEVVRRERRRGVTSPRRRGPWPMVS
jgi:hypothetical protein